MRYTFLLIDLLLLAVPVALSLFRPQRFLRYWRYLSAATIVCLILILPMEYFYSSWKLWTWNPSYLSGIKVWRFPLEVLLYYILMPIASAFLYEYARQKYLRDHARPYSRLISFGLGLVCIAILIIFNRNLYIALVLTFITFMLLLHSFVLKTGKMGRFYLGFPFMLLVFLPVRLLITSLPLLSYDYLEVSGIFIFSMPLEDLLFHLMHMLIFITVYESSIGDRTKLEKRNEKVVTGELPAEEM